MATTQEAVQISAIVPTLTVDDLQKSITFYEALGFVRALVHLDAGQRRRDREAGEECRHHAQVGAARHGVEEPRIRGQRPERFPTDRLLASIGVGRKRGQRSRLSQFPATMMCLDASP